MADCVTRVWALAIATAACIGLPSALVYAMVRVAAARRYGAAFALGLVLVFWVTVSAAYYPLVCADLFPWLRFFLRRRRAALAATAGAAAAVVVGGASNTRDGRGSGGGAAMFPWEAPPSAAARGGPRLGAADHGVSYPYEYRLPADDDIPPPPPPPPPYPCEQLQQRAPMASASRMMAALPREPPAARGRMRAGDDGEPRSKYDDCPICMEKVEEEETAKRLPMCLHLFHRQCIDQWLQGHPTCPICRCNAFLLTDSCLVISLDRR